MGELLPTCDPPILFFHPIVVLPCGSFFWGPSRPLLRWQDTRTSDSRLVILSPGLELVRTGSNYAPILGKLVNPIGPLRSFEPVLRRSSIPAMNLGPVI